MKTIIKVTFFLDSLLLLTLLCHTKGFKAPVTHSWCRNYSPLCSRNGIMGLDLMSQTDVGIPLHIHPAWQSHWGDTDEYLPNAHEDGGFVKSYKRECSLLLLHD